ncbi:MAG: DUF1593 domain-containing protein [Novosphingobium sp.]|nr:DUF1593 domain-containing protein [Novosphingobium sp.]
MKCLGALALLACLAAPAEARERLAVLTDIGNEPDDQMSLVRLLLYSNEIDIEALVATTSTWQRSKTSPEIIRKVVAAYGQVQPNLLRHAPGWPSAQVLEARISAGQGGYGLAANGRYKLSDGARALIAAGDKDDPRPLWVSVWGGANTLAQALIHVRDTRPSEGLAAFVARLRVYSISDQDDAGPWIRREFPQLFYVVTPSSPNGEEYARATWTGISGDAFYRNGAGADGGLVTNEWLDRNIRSKGPLGAAYPKFMFIMEGDTPAFLNLIPNGLDSTERPDWGGWGGRYVLRQPYGESRPIWTQGGDWFGRATSADTVAGVTSDQATIWRWRSAYQNDFAARMDWTVQPYLKANHPPEVKVGGTLRRTVRVGETLAFDARGTTDPDRDQLTFRWFAYPEAGAGTGGNLADIAVRDKGPVARVTALSPCRKAWIDDLVPCRGGGQAHLILAVTDDGSPALTRYARMILTVEPKP